jgi:hypothetical protein
MLLGETENFPPLKVPRHWSFVLLVKSWREGKALGSEESKALRIELFYGYRAEERV